MPRTFAYCRVSTLGRTVENQIREIEAAGFTVEKRRLAFGVLAEPTRKSYVTEPIFFDASV
jgi:putative DNA-invertase from lambdoid prophage Rac